jgi:hypothetical protein
MKDLIDEAKMNPKTTGGGHRFFLVFACKAGHTPPTGLKRGERIFGASPGGLFENGRCGNTSGNVRPMIQSAAPSSRVFVFIAGKPPARMPILNWLTCDSDVGAAKRLPYRLLEEAPDLSAGDPNAGNVLIQGDKALLPFYAGQVKCIYIDPPYNTCSAFQHYDDNFERLAMMWPRLKLLRDLLAEDGSIWVSIDDTEGRYLKVIMNEIFGRRKFVSNIVWQKRTSRENRAAVAERHDHILVYPHAGSSRLE